MKNFYDADFCRFKGTVKVETELMVSAVNKEEAVKIGLVAAPSEIAVYGKGEAVLVGHALNIPVDWKSMIPYSGETKETRKCIEIISEITGVPAKELVEEDIQKIISIKENSKPVIPEVVPESRPDPKPKELPWNDTNSGRPLPHLRFKI